MITSSTIKKFPISTTMAISMLIRNAEKSSPRRKFKILTPLSSPATA